MKKADDFKMRVVNSVIKTVGESEILERAAELKCKFKGRLSFVDCHVLALAKLFKGALITTDRSFKDLEGFKVVCLEV